MRWGVNELWIVARVRALDLRSYSAWDYGAGPDADAHRAGWER